MTTNKDFYTAQEAMQRLGLAKSTFYDYVRDGRIPQPQLPPSRQRGALFPAKEIDELANAMKGLILSYDEDQQEHTFRVAMPEDAQALSNFSKYVFEMMGAHGVSAKAFLEWTKSPHLEIVHILLRKGQIAGYFTTHPLHDEEIKRIMNGEIRVSQIPATQYALLEPSKPLNIYIGDLAADPKIKQASVHLIGRLLTYFHSFGKQGIEISGIYATASTRDGINICRRAGMKQVESPAIQPNWIPFEMKIQEEKSPLTSDYIKALRSYKRKQTRLQRQNKP